MPNNLVSAHGWVLSLNGQDHWFSVSGSPVYDEAGAFQGYRGWGREVTAEAEITAQLKLLCRWRRLVVHGQG